MFLLLSTPMNPTPHGGLFKFPFQMCGIIPCMPHIPVITYFRSGCSSIAHPFNMSRGKIYKKSTKQMFNSFVFSASRWHMRYIFFAKSYVISWNLSNSLILESLGNLEHSLSDLSPLSLPLSLWMVTDIRARWTFPIIHRAPMSLFSLTKSFADFFSYS